MSNVFLVLQANEETRSLVEAIQQDNPKAVVVRQPAMVKIDAPNRLELHRATIEGLLGRSFDLQALHINLITLAGHVTEDDDTFTLTWNN